ncbi:hypothetical protein M409DRAFT_25260 [Zasmidium cellare ATCC 36951]|uniref:CBS domain-containing protein n=1 Tax=Zasmidium cellare ATCC 36951 TaxID=1080233 RepID=A0A6A6CEM6_ZASCE|nr:uncharacterized protein M409DRAFT_25260 [Zasmidium cellare ATCC 36951]KAF2164382.1 hypothetical protein M409DRAFT_25260 [Zasmidium cellare ATCC 36951]
MAAATTTSTGEPREKSPWANKYRGATVEDLDPPPALSTSPHSPISHALMAAYERDYTHLTVIHPEDKSLMGYISIPHLQSLLKSGEVKDSDHVEKAMIRFKRKGKKYRLITMETKLEELEGFFEGEGMGGSKQEFAVVTDFGRRFVLGVATKEDLTKFLERRPF